MGMKHSDLHECSQLNELKVDMSVLNMIAAWHLSGDNILVEQMPIVGGYSGGLEETAICDVASTIASFAFLNADIHLGGPIHIRWGTTTNRQSLQVAAHTAMAIDTNTDLLLANQYYALAGPCTEMNLLETAAQAMCDTVCGRELLSGVASNKGVRMDMVSGMEARMMGEAAMASCGIGVHEANEILDRIVSWYEKFYFKVPAPKRFQECYNVDEITPTEEYMSVYDSSLNTLSNCGIDF
jgi:methylamine--corrinoid protein Co-methyltransferase